MDKWNAVSCPSPAGQEQHLLHPRKVLSPWGCTFSCHLTDATAGEPNHSAWTFPPALNCHLLLEIRYILVPVGAGAVETSNLLQLFAICLIMVFSVPKKMQQLKDNHCLCLLWGITIPDTISQESILRALPIAIYNWVSIRGFTSFALRKQDLWP